MHAVSAAPPKHVLNEMRQQLELATSKCGSLRQQLDLVRDKVKRTNTTNFVDGISEQNTNTEHADKNQNETSEVILMNRSLDSSSDEKNSLFEEEINAIYLKKTSSDKTKSESINYLSAKSDTPSTSTKSSPVKKRQSNDIIDIICDRLENIDDQIDEHSTSVYSATSRAFDNIDSFSDDEEVSDIFTSILPNRPMGKFRKDYKNTPKNNKKKSKVPVKLSPYQTSVITPNKPVVRKPKKKATKAKKGPSAKDKPPPMNDIISFMKGVMRQKDTKKSVSNKSSVKLTKKQNEIMTNIPFLKPKEKLSKAKELRKSKSTTATLTKTNMKKQSSKDVHNDQNSLINIRKMQVIESRETIIKNNEGESEIMKIIKEESSMKYLDQNKNSLPKLSTELLNSLIKHENKTELNENSESLNNFIRQVQNDTKTDEQNKHSNVPQAPPINNYSGNAVKTTKTLKPVVEHTAAQPKGGQESKEIKQGILKPLNALVNRLNKNENVNKNVKIKNDISVNKGHVTFCQNKNGHVKPLNQQLSKTEHIINRTFVKTEMSAKIKMLKSNVKEQKPELLKNGRAKVHQVVDAITQHVRSDVENKVNLFEQRTIPHGINSNHLRFPKNDDNPPISAISGYLKAISDKPTRGDDMINLNPKTAAALISKITRNRQETSGVPANMKDFELPIYRNKAEKELSQPIVRFNTIPFIVGQSTSKSYHIGLNVQQTLSLFKLTPTGYTDSPVMQRTSAFSLFSTVSNKNSLKNLNCPACEHSSYDENSDGDNQDAWSVPQKSSFDARSSKVPECTCLPKKLISFHQVLNKLFQKDRSIPRYHDYVVRDFPLVVEDEEDINKMKELESNQRNQLVQRQNSTFYFTKLLRNIQKLQDTFV